MGDLQISGRAGDDKVKDICASRSDRALTPVAIHGAVALAGTTVTHATLHNFDEIKRLGVRMATRSVEKAGDIIPKIIRVLIK